MMLPCDLGCGEGESCCWVMGVETCIDTENCSLNCGVCGNICEVGTLCQEGVCEAWYDVIDPCLGGKVNCGRGGEIDCLDLSDDPDNCGSCGFDCPDDGWCEDGRCVVESGEEEMTDD